MKLLLFFCIFITGCLDTSDPAEDNPELTLPVSSDSPSNNDADLPEGKGEETEDVPGEEVDLAQLLQTQEEVSIQSVGEDYFTSESEGEESSDNEESSDLPVVTAQPPLDKPVQDKSVAEKDHQDKEEEEDTVGRHNPFVKVIPLAEEDDDSQSQEEGSESDSGDEIGPGDPRVITNILLPPEEKPVQRGTSKSPIEPSKPPQAQTTRKPGQPSKVKTGNEEKNAIFMYIEDLLTPVWDLFFESSEEDLPEDAVSSSEKPSSVVTVALTSPSSNLVEDPRVTDSNQSVTVSDIARTTTVAKAPTATTTLTATTTPTVAKAPTATTTPTVAKAPTARTTPTAMVTVQAGQKHNNEVDIAQENREQYQVAENSLYKFFFTNSEGFLFLGLQKTLSDNREIFLLMEDENNTHSVLYGQIIQDLLSIESQIDFLKTEIVGNFNQYLSALCSYHSPLTEEPVELNGHDWLILSVEFNAFFPDKFHHPFIEDQYIISDVQKDDNGVVEEVILVHLTDNQKIYTLKRNVEFNAVSLDPFDVNQEIEEFIVSMESFFNNQDTLCLSSTGSSALESNT